MVVQVLTGGPSALRLAAPPGQALSPATPGPHIQGPSACPGWRRGSLALLRLSVLHWPQGAGLPLGPPLADADPGCRRKRGTWVGGRPLVVGGRDQGLGCPHLEAALTLQLLERSGGSACVLTLSPWRLPG